MTDLDARIGIAPGVLFRELDGEAILLQPETGHYFALDPVGTRIWALLAQHERLRPVFEELLGTYDVTSTTLEEDLLRFVGELAEQSLLEIDET